MRKAILFIAGIIFICTFTLQAQTEKGRIVIGASSNLGLMGTGSDVMSIGISTIKYKSDADGFTEPESDKMTSFNLIPTFGIFAANNLLIGIDVAIAYQSTENRRHDYTYTNTLLSVGPFIRYYIPSGTIKPFVEMSGSFGNIKSIFDGGDDVSFWFDDDNTQITTIGGGLGVAFPIGNKASFDLVAHYTSMTQKQKEDNDDNYRTVVGTLGLKFGFVVFLGN